MSIRRVAKRRVPPTKDSTLYFTTQSLGLCNQLFAIGCALAEGIQSKSLVAFKGFYADMTSSNYVSIERLLNLHLTNQRLAERGTKIVVKQGDFVRADMFPQKECHNAHQAFCLRSLVFADEITHLAASLTPPQPYYCVHFRLDIDFVLFYRSGLRVYREWLLYTSRGQEAAARAIASAQVAIHKQWIGELVQRYVDTVKTKCSDESLPIVALTAIGKPLMLGQNNLVEFAFEQFQKGIAPRKVIRCNSFPSLGREYSAAVELNIACSDRCVGFVASGSSTFSQTIKLRIADEAKHLGTV